VQLTSLSSKGKEKLSERTVTSIRDRAAKCVVLRYARSRSPENVESQIVIALVIKHNASLKFYVHKDIQELVSDHDKGYFEDLFPDLSERSKDSPEQVFRELSSLSAGPLRADEPTWIDASEAQIAELYPSMKLLL
jgi:hypothetical protein